MLIFHTQQGGNRQLQGGKWRFFYLVFIVSIGLAACTGSPAGNLPTRTTATSPVPVATIAPPSTPTATTAPTRTETAMPVTAIAPTASSATVTSTPTQPPLIEASPIACGLPTEAAPTLPADIPGYTQLDRSTGLHITGKYVVIDLAHYRLEVTGMVDNPLELKLEDLRCLPRVETSAPILCPGFFEDAANWAGASLDSVLELAKVQPRATNIRLVSADGYSVNLEINTARNGTNFLAYEWNGEPLPILHGFPIRAVFPGMVGGYWLKWLVKIEVY
jgi:hypothetical protein